MGGGFKHSINLRGPLESENADYAVIRRKSGLLDYANAWHLQQDCEPEVSYVANSRINDPRLVVRIVWRGTSKIVSCKKDKEVRLKYNIRA